MSGLTIVGHVGPSPAQWDMTIRGMRNSWESHEKSDSFIDIDEYDRHPSPPSFFFGPADLKLALNLAKLGADHGKYLRMLPVIVDIKAAGYWWREFDTYRVGVEASDIVQNSTSMMHVLGKEPFSSEMFCFEGVLGRDVERIIDHLNYLRDEWIAAGKRKGPEIETWRALQQAIPYGWLYQRTVSFNYQVLRSIYHARKNHRLAEWRDFCGWIATLEHSELLTGEA
jgi:hypothetical protein